MNNLQDDFEIQWQRRQQALNEALDSVPSDEAILDMAKIAQRKNKFKMRWYSYAAAACLLMGVLLYGLRFTKTETNLPVAEEIIVKGEKILFLCNSGCSAQDVILSANKIVNQE
jgi:hypothetical protein